MRNSIQAYTAKLTLKGNDRVIVDLGNGKTRRCTVNDNRVEGEGTFIYEDTFHIQGNVVMLTKNKVAEDWSNVPTVKNGDLVYLDNSSPHQEALFFVTVSGDYSDGVAFFVSKGRMELLIATTNIIKERYTVSETISY